MNNLSSKAKAAITDANNSSGKVHPSAGPEVLAELREAGMIGRGDGLTMRGRIARDRITEAALDAAF